LVGGCVMSGVRCWMCGRGDFGGVGRLADLAVCSCGATLCGRCELGCVYCAARLVRDTLRPSRQRPRAAPEMVRSGVCKSRDHGACGGQQSWGGECGCWCHDVELVAARAKFVAALVEQAGGAAS
jgi:hypothetical protein